MPIRFYLRINNLVNFCLPSGLLGYPCLVYHFLFMLSIVVIFYDGFIKLKKKKNLNYVFLSLRFSIGFLIHIRCVWIIFHQTPNSRPENWIVKLKTEQQNFMVNNKLSNVLILQLFAHFDLTVFLPLTKFMRFKHI